MKNLLSVFICMLIILSLPPCEQKETAQLLNADNEIRISIFDVGLENVLICDASAREIHLGGEDIGQVFLLGDDHRYTAPMMDHYLAVVIGEKTILKDLVAYEGHFNLAGNMEVCDVDGDHEILLQQTVGMSGGAGSYLSRVFDYCDGEMLEIFSSDNIFKKYSNNMGFSCTLLENHEFRIDNEITGYSEIFHMENRPEEYFKWWYDVNGKMYQREILVDSFYEFLPIDIDGDRVYEIACRQFVSLIGHSDGIGCAKTVLKYNTATSDFEIIDASFELYN